MATPVLSGKVTDADFNAYLAYVGKHGSREQVIQATLGATGVYNKAYGQQVAKMEAAGIAGTVAAAPVAIAGAGAVATGAVAGGTTGFVSGLLDKVSAKALVVRTATGAVLGAGFGWVAQRVGAFIAGEASPSVPGASETDAVAMKAVSGEPPPMAASASAVSDEALASPTLRAGEAAADDLAPLAGGEVAPSGAASADAGTVGKLTYRHQLKAGKTTDVADLKAQITQEVDTMNEIMKEEGIEGLQQRILAYRADPAIEAAGRAHVRGLGPAGCTECGDPLAWVHRLDMSKGGSVTDIAGKGLLRNNSIIGGQANRLADEILKMPPGTTRIEWELALKQARVRTSQ